ncbi:MAG: UMP kinase [Candidatus Lokiarchaeota archaeon]|nr:UMP kinase [Candidatus Lokiarchaeota archaeon]
MRLVLKLGGSLLYNKDNQIIITRIKEYAKVIAQLAIDGHDIAIVVGGGKPARAFISAARELGASEAQCDWLGIKTSRLNAELLCASLQRHAYPKIVESLDELEIAAYSNHIVLMGGLTPGQSTNAVAALAAEITHADLLLNATNVDGVYDKDPNDPGAIKLDDVSIENLEIILSGGGTRAGEYRLFDPVAIRVVKRSKIGTVIFNGLNPSNISKIVAGEKIGTMISHKTSSMEE